jgi:tetratricopeptide (TPR) repeat protein
MEKRDFAGAEAAFRDAIRVRPAYPDPHNNLGNALKNQDDRAGAVAAFRKAIELQPQFLEAHFNLGELYYATGDMAAAVVEFRAVLGIDPDEPETLVYLGMSLSRLGRFGEALGPLRRGHDLGHKQPGWPFPNSAALAKQCEDLAKLETKLDAVLAGRAEPADAAERVALADMCRVHKKLYAAGVRFAREAMAADPALTRVPDNNLRYNAACAAVLAAAGRGDDPPPGADRPGFREQAREWLTADLAVWRETAGRSPALVHSVLTHWQKDADLAGVRHPFRLAALPPPEARAWLALWADVRDLWGQTVPAVAPPPRPGRSHSPS